LRSRAAYKYPLIDSDKGHKCLNQIWWKLGEEWNTDLQLFIMLIEEKNKSFNPFSRLPRLLDDEVFGITGTKSFSTMSATEMHFHLFFLLQGIYSGY
jgi:hypothetical protein